MRKNESPQGPQRGLLVFLLLISAVLVGTSGCGGGSSGSSFTSGGGGGGGGGGGTGNSPPCTFTQSASTTTTGTGLNTQVGEHYFGMHLNSENAPWPFYEVGGSQPALPFYSQRLWAAGVAWSQVNTSQGVFDWTGAPQNMDTWMSDAQAHPGVDTLYTLARTPSWASTNPSDETCVDSGDNGGGQCYPPIDLNSDGSGTNAIWIAWVTAAAQYSVAEKKAGAPGFSYYEIWNEWNTSVSWQGTTPQLVRMEQDARCVVEGPPTGMACNPNSAGLLPAQPIDPTAKIVSPSPVGAAADNMLGTVAASLATYFSTKVNGYAGGSFSDAIGFHGYVGTATKTGTNAVPCPTPENVNIVMADLNTTLAQFPAMAGKPLFNTEGGWSQAPSEGFTDLDRQAAFLPRYLLLQQSDDVSRVYWFAWDSKTDSSLYDVAEPTEAGNPTPAATAYGEVYKWTEGATVSQACTTKGTVWTCGFTRPGGYSALAVWDASQDCTTSSCPTTTFTVPAGYIEYRDINDDNETLLSGATTVQIGAKPILLETAPLP